VNIASEAPLNLLHAVPNGTLATHSRDPAGFPYPTALPFAPDARHAPMLVISRLAEHTRNLQADARAGFLVARDVEGNVLEGQRLTLLGSFEPATPARVPELARRYLRYHPDAARYLELGDFAIWTMTLERMRFIGGFGAMGWLDAQALDPHDPLAAEDESALCDFADGFSKRPPDFHLLGIDRYGCDFRHGTSRNRFTFDKPKLNVEALKAGLLDCMSGLR
jgi:putative heme iron utilization protein